MSILHTYVSTQRPEEDGGAGVSEGCAWPFGCWQSNLDPLQGRQVLLIPGPPLQPHKQVILKNLFQLFNKVL